MSTPAVAITLNCGHPSTPSKHIPGYATDAYGDTMCFRCAAEADQRRMAQDGAVTGYVNEPGRRITTWPGLPLMTITHLTHGPWRYTSGGRWRTRYVRAVAPDGSYWYGRGSDAHDLITMRRYRRED